MVDLIDRQAVQEMVDRIGDTHPYRQIGNRESYSQYNEAWTDAINRVDAELNSLPSADIDLSDFSDKLWKTAYERGKAEVVRHGRWIRGSGYPHHIFCSVCYATYVPNDEWDIWKTDGSDCFRLQRNFCPYCGAKMDEVT